MIINPGIWEPPAWEFPKYNRQLLASVENNFPITHEQDLVLLKQNETGYQAWLETCTEERSSKPPYVQGNVPYNTVLNRVSQWIRILTDGSAAAIIRKSGNQYLDVYVDFAEDTLGGYAGGFFLSLCFQHMKMAAWMFTEDKIARVTKNTQHFVTSDHR